MTCGQYEVPTTNQGENTMFKKLLNFLALFAVLGGLFLSAPRAHPVKAEGEQTYLVLYKQEKVPADAASVFANAGGSLVYSYNQIGVAIARSPNAEFRNNLLKDARVEG